MGKFGFWNKFIENQIDKDFGLKDIDNNQYSLKRFNGKTWTINNLNTGRFRNGDTIREVKSNSEWIKACDNKEPAWCHYNNDPKYSVFGKLYNIYAVTDYRELAPEKYHIPSDNEWDMILNFMGGAEVAGEKMGMSSDFQADLSGSRTGEGDFSFFNMAGVYWSNTLSTSEKAWIRVFYLTLKNVGRNDNSKYIGAYVRCVKD